jgi:polysaccharide export outer membrane protein
MKPLVLFASLIALAFGGCSWIPKTGPSTSEVVEEGQRGSEILYDVVPVDDRVVSTLLARPKESFAARFRKDTQPPEIRIAVGDTVTVMIWESAAGGLFTEPLPTLSPPTSPGAKPETEPLAPESQPPAGERRNEFVPPGRLEERPRDDPPTDALSAAASGVTPGQKATVIPDQQVGADGGISIPYAGRIRAAGRFPREVQQTIEARLAEKALQPQALVIVPKSAANAVTVLLGESSGESSGKTGVASLVSNLSNAAPAAVASLVGNLSNAAAAGAAAGAAARVPLSPGGDRLLQVIAAAGGARAPVHDVFVQLSRGDITAMIPLQQLVSDPAEDIFAQPGDVLTLIRLPQSFSVFGATGRNAEIPFGAERITVAEALGKSQGLRDDLAEPEGVFLFRYEPNSLVRALDEPIASVARGEVSPIVYRFNLRDGKTFLLAQQFPMRDKDVILVADAASVQAQKLSTLLQTVTGPVITGLLVCRSGNTKC